MIVGICSIQQSPLSVLARYSMEMRRYLKAHQLKLNKIFILAHGFRDFNHNCSAPMFLRQTSGRKHVAEPAAAHNHGVLIKFHLPTIATPPLSSIMFYRKAPHPMNFSQ